MLFDSHGLHATCQLISLSNVVTVICDSHCDMTLYDCDMISSHTLP